VHVALFNEYQNKNKERNKIRILFRTCFKCK